MKKLFLYLSLISVLYSCNRDYRKFTITDFSKRRVDTLKPYKHKTYVTFFVRVKGYSNDTIKIKRISYLEGSRIPKEDDPDNYYYDINLSGEIDAIMRVDYYGGFNFICIFDRHC